LVFCPPSIRAGGGAGLLFLQEHGGIPPTPPFRHALVGTDGSPAKSFLPPTPSTFCLLAGGGFLCGGFSYNINYILVSIYFNLVPIM
jgi:hypothetical protein